MEKCISSPSCTSPTVVLGSSLDMSGPLNWLVLMMGFRSDKGTVGGFCLPGTSFFPPTFGPVSLIFSDNDEVPFDEDLDVDAFDPDI